jgi:hypothetical protein
MALQRAPKLTPTPMRGVREHAHAWRHSVVVEHKAEWPRVRLRRWPSQDQIHLSDLRMAYGQGLIVGIESIVL